MSAHDRVAVSARITGRVQGVSYRYWTREQAVRLGLSGWVRNEADGSVSALFAGSPSAVADMIRLCREGPRFSRVSGVETCDVEQDLDDAGFQITR